MQRLSLRSAISLVVALSLSGSARAHVHVEVHVVDGLGGGDFTHVQAAVDAASDGDLILIRGGTYPGFSIVAKSLLVQADDATVKLILNASGPTLQVRDLAENQVVRIRGIEITQPTPFVTSSDTIVLLSDNAGLVALEDCTVSDGGEPGNGFLDSDSDAVRAFGCANLLLNRCTLVGHGTSWEFGNGVGLYALDSRVRLEASNLRGAHGEDALSAGAWGGSGGAGVLIEDSQVFASGSSFQGGDAGFGLGTHGKCLDGVGGDGAFLRPGGTLNARDCVFGGGADLCHGPNSQPIGGNVAAARERFEPARSFIAESPVRAGATIQLDFFGEPSDSAFLWWGEDLGAMPLKLGLIGTPVPLLGRIDFMGPILGSGHMTRVFPLPFTPAPLDFIGMEFQAAFVAGGEFAQLTSRTVVPILDSSL